MMRPGLVSLWILFSGTLASGTQVPTFSVATEEVRMDVLVTEDGKPVAGLDAADFEVLDNGVVQRVQYVKRQQRIPISAVLVFDMSSSVAGEQLDDLKEAAHAFLSDFGKDDYAALIVFNHAVVLRSPFSREFERIRQALDRAQSSGDSSLIDAGYTGLILAQSRPDPPLVIIFSDGVDTYSWLTGEAVLETAKRTEAVVYAVSAGRLRDKAFLSELVKLTGGSSFEVERSTDLKTALLQILDEFRQRYVLTYTPQGVAVNGWHRLEVRVKNRSAKIKTRPGYIRNLEPK